MKPPRVLFGAVVGLACALSFLGGRASVEVPEPEPGTHDASWLAPAGWCWDSENAWPARDDGTCHSEDKHPIDAPVVTWGADENLIVHGRTGGYLTAAEFNQLARRAGCPYQVAAKGDLVEQAERNLMDCLREHPARRATLEDVRRDWKIDGQLTCAVISKDAPPWLLWAVNGRHGRFAGFSENWSAP